MKFVIEHLSKKFSNQQDLRGRILRVDQILF